MSERESPRSFGLPRLSDHALARIRARWRIEHPAAAHLWALRRMGGARSVTCELHRPYTHAPRLIWWCAGDVQIVTDGPWIITAMGPEAAEDGRRDSGEDGDAA